MGAGSEQEPTRTKLYQAKTTDEFMTEAWCVRCILVQMWSNILAPLHNSLFLQKQVEIENGVYNCTFQRKMSWTLD